jgi:LPXTG-motif cell wall-anchored protein
MSIAKKITALLLMLTLLCATAVQGFAREVPDPDRRGTLTLTMKLGDTLVTDGSVLLYRVGDVTEDDGNDTFVLNDTFQSAGVTLGSDADLQSDANAKTLADFASSNQVKGTSGAVSSTGTVTFSDLEIGLYLVVQETAAAGYTDITPFLVSIPELVGETYLYEVDASPKVELSIDNTPVETPPVESTPVESTPVTTPTTTQTTVTTSKLPQTGQLNWPVPVMALAGILLMLTGWWLCSKRNGEPHET